MLLVDVDSRFSFESGGSAAGVGVGDDAGGGEEARTLPLEEQGKKCSWIWSMLEVTFCI